MLPSTALRRCLGALASLPSTSAILPSRTLFSSPAALSKKKVSMPLKAAASPKPVIPKETVAEEETEDGLPKDYKIKIIKVGSRRLDTFVARSAGVPGSEAEKLVLSGKVRVNDEKSSKKSYNIQRGDVVDIWREICEDNADFAYTFRSEIRDYAVTEAGYDINIHHWQRFLVENWR